MQGYTGKTWAFLSRVINSWYTAGFVTLLMLGALLFWVAPKRYEKVVSIDGAHEWDTDKAPPRREFLWDKAKEIEGLVKAKEKILLVSPRLTDGGATMYFSRRTPDGHADIYVTRMQGDSWQSPQAVKELNTDMDELGPVVSPDGKYLYFYSNRPGSLGGTDLYMAKRTKSGWGPPKNLGPLVNTRADEQDPALSPDGSTLYFASNRTQEMIDEAANIAKGDKPKAKKWAATSRQKLGQQHFDLYTTNWSEEKSDWELPSALDEINTADAHEAAPFVSPNGVYLYFASDREARAGEKTNLDIWRAQISKNGISNIINLGPNVNTAANETEPAVSPEGFKLVFSRNVHEYDRLFESKAIEVVHDVHWDDARWSVFMSVWWKILLLLLGFALLLAILWYSHGWLLEKATAARFLAASFLIHLLILLIMWLIPIAKEIIRGTTDEGPIVATPQNVTPENGPQAYNKVADLKPMEQIPSPSVPRRVVSEPQPIEQPEQLDQPTVPAPAARMLPPDRVRFVPLKTKTAVVEKKFVLPRRSPAKLPQMAKLEPVEPKLPEGEALPEEQPLPQPTVKVGPRKPAKANSVEPPPEGEVVKGKETPLKLETLNMQKPELTQKATDQRLVPPSPLAKRSLPREMPKPFAELDSPPVLAKADPGDEKSVEPPKQAKLVLQKSNKKSSAPLTSIEDDLPKPSPKTPSPFIPSNPLISKLTKPKPKLPGLPKPLARQAMQPVLPDTTTLEETTPQPGNVVENPTEKPLPNLKIEVAKATAPFPLKATPDDREPPEIPAPGPLSVPFKKAPTPEWKVSPDFNPMQNQLAKRAPALLRIGEPLETIGMSKMLVLRKPEMRKKLIKDLGGTPESEKAVERGLKWLAENQNADGSWSLHKFQGNHRSDIAATGLALLPFFGAGHTHLSGEYQQTVDKGLNWLIKHQEPNGRFDHSPNSQMMYGQGIASIAMCEAFALSRDGKLREPAQRAVNFICKAQHGGGGWRYNPGQSGDTSVLGWQVMALKSAEMGGLSVPEKIFKGVHRYLRSVEDRRNGGGRFGYTNPSPSPAMTAQGLLCLQYLGIERNDKRLLNGANYLLDRLPKRNEDTSYYWYHATQVMYHLQSEYWEAWNNKLRDMLVETQIKNGRFAGTWQPRDRWENSGGRIFSTSLRLLMLEVYYRHLPLYKQLER